MTDVDARTICYPIGFCLCLAGVILFFGYGNGPLAALCTISGLATMAVGDCHAGM